MRARTILEYNFEREGNILDKLQVGKIKERKFRKARIEIKKAIKILTIENDIEEDDIYDLSGAGKNSIEIGFNKNNVFYEIAYLEEDMDNGLEYTFEAIYQIKLVNGEFKEDEIPLDTVKECMDQIRTWIKNIGNRYIVEKLNFEREGDSLDKLQIGRISERKMEREKEKMEKVILSIMKQNHINKDDMYSDTGENFTAIFFKYKIYDYFIKYDYSNGFSTGIYHFYKNDEPILVDEIEYDTIEQCTMKILWWLKNN
jgi:hypothetical protein